MSAASGPLFTVADVEGAFLRDRALITRICLGYLHNADDADDAAQETFARVMAHAGAITGDLGSYMKMTARNVCRDLRRRREVERRCPGLAVGGGGDDPQSVAVEHHQFAAVLPRMSASDLRLIALHFAGFSYEEIARRLGRSATSVSVGLTRARKRARHLAESPARLGAWLGLLSPWRRAARLRSVLLTPEAGLVSPCATVLTAIALLTMPFTGGANVGVTGHQRPVPSADGRSTAPANLVGPPAVQTSVEVATDDAMRRAAAATDATPRRAPLTASRGSDTGLAPNAQSTAFTTVVASPDYAQDHTAYASGYSPSCACGVYFVTHDAARSWHLLPGVTLGGARLLGVVEPGDRLLAVIAGLGLVESTPGATAFGQTIPAVHAAVAPDGRNVMLVTPTHAALVRYDTYSTLLSPGPHLPPKFQVDDLAYAGAAGTLLIAGFSTDPGSSPGEVILACSALACTTRTTLALAPGAETLVTPPASASTSDVALVGDWGRQVLVSSDTGQSWHSLFPREELANAGMVAFVSTRDGTSGVVVGQWSGPTFPVVRFTGASFTPAPFDPVLFGPWPLYVMVQLPDGRLLANFANGPHGLLCSTDDGTSWAPECP